MWTWTSDWNANPLVLELMIWLTVTVLAAADAEGLGEVFVLAAALCSLQLTLKSWGKYAPATEHPPQLERAHTQLSSSSSSSSSDTDTSVDADYYSSSSSDTGKSFDASGDEDEEQMDNFYAGVEYDADITYAYNVWCFPELSWTDERPPYVAYVSPEEEREISRVVEGSTNVWCFECGSDCDCPFDKSSD